MQITSPTLYGQLQDLTPIKIPAQKIGFPYFFNSGESLGMEAAAPSLSPLKQNILILREGVLAKPNQLR